MGCPYLLRQWDPNVGRLVYSFPCRCVAAEVSETASAHHSKALVVSLRLLARYFLLHTSDRDLAKPL